MGSRKGLSTLDDTLGLTGKLSRCDRNKQALQNCRAGQGDILARGGGTAASHSFMHCQKYRCSRSPPRNQLRTWHRRPLLLPPAPKLLSQPCNLHPMTLHVRPGSWRRPRSNDSQSCLALRARRQTRRRPLRRWNACRPLDGANAPRELAISIIQVAPLRRRRSAGRGPQHRRPGLRMTSLGSAPRCHKKGNVENCRLAGLE